MGRHSTEYEDGYVEEFNFGGPKHQSYKYDSDSELCTDDCPIDTQCSEPEYKPCKPSNQFENIQNTVNDACINTNNASLCRAIRAGEVVEQIPFKCFVDTIRNNSYCGMELDKKTRDRAFEAFTDVTGYEPFDLEQLFENLYDQNNAIILFNTFYMFMPVLILILVAIWVMVGFRKMHWGMALLASELAIVILYGFSIVYRINAQIYLRNRNNKELERVKESQDNYQNSIAYLPQAMMAVSCAVSSGGAENSWECNALSNNTTPTNTLNTQNLQPLNTNVQNPQPMQNSQPLNQRTNNVNQNVIPACINGVCNPNNNEYYQGRSRHRKQYK